MKYILKGKKPIPEPDVLAWADWFEKEDRTIAFNEIEGVSVSTVFLGVDYGLRGAAKPLLFETMIFGGKYDMYQDKYATWDKAIEGHKVAVKLAKEKKKECPYFKKYKKRPIKVKKSAKRGSAKETRSIAHKKRSR